MQLPLCYPWCKSEKCGMKGRTCWQGIAGDTRMGMFKEDHGQDTGAARRKRNTAVLELGVRKKGSLLHNASVCVLSNKLFYVCTRQMALELKVL